jgi:hypothetical protein
MMLSCVLIHRRHKRIRLASIPTNSFLTQTCGQWPKQCVTTQRQCEQVNSFSIIQPCASGLSHFVDVICFERVSCVLLLDKNYRSRPRVANLLYRNKQCSRHIPCNPWPDRLRMHVAEVTRLWTARQQYIQSVARSATKVM